jgi:hypothetical protein
MLTALIKMPGGTSKVPVGQREMKDESLDEG